MTKELVGRVWLINVNPLPFWCILLLYKHHISHTHRDRGLLQVILLEVGKNCQLCEDIQKAFWDLSIIGMAFTQLTPLTLSSMGTSHHCWSELSPLDTTYPLLTPLSPTDMIYTLLNTTYPLLTWHIPHWHILLLFHCPLQTSRKHPWFSDILSFLSTPFTLWIVCIHVYQSQN